LDWDTVGFVFSSQLRLKILLVLRESKNTPKQLSASLKKPMSHVSKALKQLSERQLVECLTPKRRKGRLYDITKRGNQVLDEIGKIGRKPSD
jgi:predicted transcriptional regulator